MLKKLRFLIGLSVLLVVMVYAIAFARKNSGDVALDFMVGGAVSLPAGVWLGLGVALGACLGIATSIWAVTKLRFAKKRLRNQNKKLQEQELGQ